MFNVEEFLNLPPKSDVGIIRFGNDFLAAL